MLPKEVKLFFQEGNSDKVYDARIVPAGASVYDVVVQWGRRGSTLSQGKKAVKVSLEKAHASGSRKTRWLPPSALRSPRSLGRRRSSRR